MPKSSSLMKYPAEYETLLDRALSSNDPIEIETPSRARAEAFRFDLYAYMKALLRADLQARQWNFEHRQGPLAQEYPIAERAQQLILRVQGQVLVISNRSSSDFGKMLASQGISNNPPNLDYLIKTQAPIEQPLSQQQTPQKPQTPQKQISQTTAIELLDDEVPSMDDALSDLGFGKGDSFK